MAEKGKGVGIISKEKNEFGTSHESGELGYLGGEGGRMILDDMNDGNDRMILDDECLDIEQKRKKRILPIWMPNPKQLHSEKNACVKAEKNDSLVNDPKKYVKKIPKINKKNKKEGEERKKVEKEKIVKEKNMKKNENDKNPVTLNCVKVEGHRWDNMPGPENPEQALITKLCRDKMTSVPSLSLLTADSTTIEKSTTIDTSIPAMPADPTTIEKSTTIDTSIRAKPAWKGETTTTTTTILEWPDTEEDGELETKMIQLQIKLEREKEERFMKRERRRKEDDAKLLRDVILIEEREERLERCRKLREEAKEKEDQEWLQVALLSEEAYLPSPSPPSSPGDPPPSLLAERPVGAEPWGKERKMMTTTGSLGETDTSSPASPTPTKDIPAREKMTPPILDAKPATISQAKESGKARTPPSKHVLACKIARPEEQGGPSTTMKEHTDAPYSAPTPAQGLVMKKDKGKQLDKAAASMSKQRLSLQKSRSQRRDSNQLKIRNIPSTLDEPDQTPAANPMVSKLVSRFETSQSPLKMPRPPTASTAVCRRDNVCLLNCKCHLPSSASDKSKPKARPGNGDRK